MDRTNKRLFFICIQIGCAVLIIITMIEKHMFDSHKNNVNLNYHTECVFAVRILSFIHHPQRQLEYTHQHVRLLLVCHHQNAKCSCFCWVRWLSCVLASFYCPRRSTWMIFIYHHQNMTRLSIYHHQNMDDVP